MSILEHHFPPLIAEKYGVNAAIFLRDIYHWCETNQNNRENFHEGRWWTYQTISGLCRRHTYWTKNQVEHIIRTCKEKGALLSGHFSDNQFDRTCWYALTDEALALFDGPYSISDNSEIDSQEITPLSRKNQKCYKDKHRTEDRTNTPYSPPEGDGAPPVQKGSKREPDWDLFERFWKKYPRKQDKERARRAWRKINPDLALCRIMSAALEQDKQSEQWQEDGGRYIPHPSTWLNGRRWEDEHRGRPASAPSGSVWADDPEVV